ncbi:hypothetical protein WA026_013621 [Henosepilachna vigintioctopunctata]|uniref:CS domain-containing protein n=1 Tax=Henosepilachna vigintioctopunctata TaxID=420089 RepID=A0AAW1V1L6_9CUCU
MIRKDVRMKAVLNADVKDPEVKFEKDSIHFKGTGGVENKIYEVTSPLYKEIDSEKSESFPRGRYKKKYHWLKCDFNKWNDEDETGDEGLGGMGGGGDFEEMMKQMGGLGGAGKEKLSFEDIELDGDEADSDDEPIP